MRTITSSELLSSTKTTTATPSSRPHISSALTGIIAYALPGGSKSTHRNRTEDDSAAASRPAFGQALRTFFEQQVNALITTSGVVGGARTRFELVLTSGMVVPIPEFGNVRLLLCNSTQQFEIALALQQQHAVAGNSVGNGSDVGFNDSTDVASNSRDTGSGGGPLETLAGVLPTLPGMPNMVSIAAEAAAMHQAYQSASAAASSAREARQAQLVVDLAHQLAKQRYIVKLDVRSSAPAAFQNVLFVPATTSASTRAIQRSSPAPPSPWISRLISEVHEMYADHNGGDVQQATAERKKKMKTQKSEEESDVDDDSDVDDASSLTANTPIDGGDEFAAIRGGDSVAAPLYLLQRIGGLDKEVSQIIEHVKGIVSRHMVTRSITTASNTINGYADASVTPTTVTAAASGRNGGVGEALLIHGQHGTGKTALAHGVMHYFRQVPHIRAHVERVVCSELSGARHDQVVAALSKALTRCIERQPSVIVLDDIDVVLPAAASADSPSAQSWQLVVHTQLIIASLTTWLARLHSQCHRVAVIFTSQNEQSLHAGLLDPSMLKCVVNCPAPSRRARADILQKLSSSSSSSSSAKELQHTNGLIHEFDASDVAMRTEGYMGSDLVQLIERARHLASVRLIQRTSAAQGAPVIQPTGSDYQDNQQRHLPQRICRPNGKKVHHHQQQRFTRATNSDNESDYDSDYGNDDNDNDGPTTDHEELLTDSIVAPPPPSSISLTTQDVLRAMEDYVPVALKGAKLQKASVAWGDIGGLASVRETLKQTLEWPSKYSFLFKSMPIRHRSGVLLYGPSGCGKTMLACAIAAECGLNLISVKGPELLNKYIGQSEQSVRTMFERAAAAAPCVLFFDEFDAIAPRRGHDNTGVTDRVVNQFLTQLDGVEVLEGVYVMAATSRPDLVDPALLRPGRLDKCLYVGVPTVEERADILRVISRKLNVAEDIDWNVVAAKTERYTGADLDALLYTAQLDAIHSQLDQHVRTISSNKVDTSDVSSRSSHAHSRFRLAATASSSSSTTTTQGLLLTTQDQQLITRQIGSIRTNIKAEGNRLGGDNHRGARTTEAGNRVVQITQHHMSRALDQSQPSISVSEQKRFDNMFVKQRSSGPPARSTRS
jgi:SpoVK/Ycf46/Vps4 family AAA+-type ATPase